VKLAMYDPSQPSTDGSFWSWRAPSIDQKLLDSLYYDFAKYNRPEDPSQLSDSSIVGGFVALTPDRVFAYRFGNGGRDARGRPGRFVMVVASLRVDQSRVCGLAAVMTCPVFAAALAKAPFSCPVPAPAELEIDVITPPSRVDLVLVAKAIREERLELSGPEAMREAAEVCGSLPADRQWRCSLRVDDDVCIAVVECPRVAEKPALPPPILSPIKPSVPAPPESRTSVRVVSPLAFWNWWRHASRPLRHAVAALLIVSVCVLLWEGHQTGHGGIAPLPGNNGGRFQPMQPDRLRHPSSQEADMPDQWKPPANSTMKSKSGDWPPVQVPSPQNRGTFEGAKPLISSTTEQQLPRVWAVTIVCIGTIMAIVMWLVRRKLASRPRRGR